MKETVILQKKIMKKFLIYSFCYLLSGCGIIFSGGCRSHKDVSITERDSLRVSTENVHILKTMEISDIIGKWESSKVKVEFEEGKGKIIIHPDGDVGICGVKALTDNKKSASKFMQVVKMRQDSLAAEMETWQESVRIEENKIPERSGRESLRIAVLIAIVAVLFIVMFKNTYRNKT